MIGRIHCQYCLKRPAPSDHSKEAQDDPNVDGTIILFRTNPKGEIGKWVCQHCKFNHEQSIIHSESTQF